MGSYDNRFPDSKKSDFVRPDMFHPASLTDEEAEVMKQLRYESAWKRGYPIAFISGAATSMLTRRFSMIARISLTTFSAILGNVTGRISYLPTIHQRLMTDLPIDSPLRQKLQQLKEKGPQSFQDPGQDEHDMIFDTGSSPDDTPHEESPPSVISPQEGTATPQKKYVSYEELRQQNRKGPRQYPVAPSSDESMQSDVELSVTPTEDENRSSKRKRYNKYGDEIVG